MSFRCPSVSLWVISAALWLFVAQVPTVAESKSLVLATANTEGLYYPVGVAISTLLSSKLAASENLVVTAINTTGSGENIDLLTEGKCDLALVSGLYAVQAYRGMGFYEGRAMTGLKAVAPLWDNVEHYVIRNEFIRNGDLSDLKGLSGAFSIGKFDRGAIGSEQVIFDALDIVKGKDFDVEYLGYLTSVEALLNKEIAGGAFAARQPVVALEQLFDAAGDRVSFLEVTDLQLKKINKSYGLWKRQIIEAWTYRGQRSDIQTISYPNLLLASGRLTEDEVYLITRCIFENLPQLVEMHEATQSISLIKTAEGMPLPIHPGAARFYREAGLTLSHQP